MISRHFGYYLKEKRKQLGLSQADLADKAKIQRTSISRLEGPGGNPQWAIIRAIAEDGMGISVPEFFQVEPIEARQPVIVVGAEAPAPKLAELMLKTQGKAIPVINSITALRSKVITDQDIIGYSVLDHGLLADYIDRKLILWVSHDHKQRQDWLIADIEDTAIEDQSTYLVVLDDKVVARQAWISPNGALTLVGLAAHERPASFWGRQKDRVECLGRVILTSVTYLR